MKELRYPSLKDVVNSAFFVSQQAVPSAFAAIVGNAESHTQFGGNTDLLPSLYICNFRRKVAKIAITGTRSAHFVSAVIGLSLLIFSGVIFA